MTTKATKYRAAGLPVMIRKRLAPSNRDALDRMRSLYARYYWSPRTSEEKAALLGALVAWPGLLIEDMSRSTRRNGRIVARRHGRSIVAQLFDQLRLYFRHGIFPRWYYIFELYLPDGPSRARSYMHRFETKTGGIYRLLKGRARSPLNDKVAFAAFCAANDISCVPVVAADGRAIGPAEDALPAVDLFIKPVSGRGGTGAERWDHEGDGRYRGPDGTLLSARDLIASTAGTPQRSARLVQPRAVNDPALADVSVGALCTVRLLTCLNEVGEPEPIGAAFRMAIGRNVTVDNFHAGGIAASVDLESGTLSQASNIGANVRLGWLTHHPDTGAAIEGRTLPHWDRVKELAVAAHRSFSDRVVVGWDIGLLADGPTLVEGNSGPDLDILQRLLRRGLGDGRLPELLAFHIERRLEQDKSARLARSTALP